MVRYLAYLSQESPKAIREQMNVTSTRWILIILLSFSGGLILGQGKLKRAVKEMEALNFSEAIELLQEYVEKENAPEAKLQLAECYRRTNNWDKARFWYEQIIETSAVRPEHQLYYAQALQRSGQSIEAGKWYEAYLKHQPNDVRAANLLRSCRQAEQLQNRNRRIYQIENLSVNTPFSEHSPTFYTGGLLFASDRDDNAPISRTNAFTGFHFLDFYFSPGQIALGPHCRSTELATPEKLNSKLNSAYHDATITFAQNGQMAFFTRTTFEHKSSKGIARLKIFQSRKTGPEEWSEARLLPFNENDYSYAHPTASNDGRRLFFSSDRAGGYGGMDLYLTEFINGQWTPPINLGPSINTEGNEVFPYYLEESGLLYFSSDGHISMGGLDILKVKEKERRNWGEVINLGYPINSFSDDFGICIAADGTYGYFSSDRIGGRGKDDLYAFCKASSQFEFFVYDIKSKQAIPGVVISGNCSHSFANTGADGKSRQELVLGDCCTLSFQAEGYLPNQRQLCAKERGSRTFIEIPLEPEPVVEIEGIVFDEEDFPMEGATVTLFTECPQSPPVSMITNATGRFYFKVERNCCYTAIAAAPGYPSVSSAPFCALGLKENKTFQASFQLRNATSPPLAQGQQKGWVFDQLTPKSPVVPSTFPLSKSAALDEKGTPKPYLLPIFFEFNSARLVPASLQALQQLHFFLLENPGVIIEIGAHTDSRGSDPYNLQLSQKRSEAVRSWLIGRGIEGSRLIAKGYGETRIINHCKNDISCSDEEHEVNRRTEFRILNEVQ
jgi:outer membrane protein OmpA-like peptidoglycan-associated protein/tetratricopeptide (TPR) repeat protein